MEVTAGLRWQIEECTAKKTDGVFSVTVVWTLHVPIVNNYIDMLPDVVAARYIAAGILPIEGYTYPAYPFASVRSVECKQVEGGIYRYTAEYSDKNSSEQQKGTDENPLLDRPIVKPTAGMITRALTRDIFGKPILNRAGDPIVQTVEDNTIGLSITANVPYVHPAFLALRNTCNIAAISVSGIGMSANAARFVLPSNWVSEPKARNDIPYLEFTYELLIDEYDLHYGRPLNAGFRTKTGLVPERLKTITNGDGSEISEPAMLDEEGFWIPDATPDDAYFLTVKKYPPADYSILPGVS